MGAGVSASVDVSASAVSTLNERDLETLEMKYLKLKLGGNSGVSVLQILQQDSERDVYQLIENKSKSAAIRIISVF